FVELPELRKLRDDVDARWSWEVANQTGANLDDDAPPALDAQELKKRFGAAQAEPFSDGYFQPPDARALVVNVETSLASGDVKGMRAALAHIRATTEAVQRLPEHGAVKVAYAGDLVTGLAEYGAALNDLANVGAIGLGLVT